MATMSVTAAVRKLHVFLLVTILAVAVVSALPLSEEELKTQEGLIDMDLDQLSQLQNNVRLNIHFYRAMHVVQSAVLLS